MDGIGMCCRMTRRFKSDCREAVRYAQHTEKRKIKSVGGLRNGQDSEHAAILTVENEMNDAGLGQRAMSCA